MSNFTTYEQAVEFATSDQELSDWMAANRPAFDKTSARAAFDNFVNAPKFNKAAAARIALQYSEFLSEKQIAWAAKFAN